MTVEKTCQTCECTECSEECECAETHDARLQPAGEVAQRPTNGEVMKIAIPVAGGRLASHFGHCEEFALFEVGADGKTIRSKTLLTPPPHEPGTFPKWLSGQGATVVIAGGMGSRAQGLFAENKIRVIVGAPDGEPDVLVQEFLAARLVSGPNACDH
jgi:predicted Fe-Mo cluster-binding NifX family protein